MFFSVVELARERILYIFSQSAYFFEKSDYCFENAASVKCLKFPDILVDVSNYIDPRLLQSSLHLLNRFVHIICSYCLGSYWFVSLYYIRYYSSEMTLFEKAIQTQLLIAPKSCEVFNDIGELLPTLRRYMSIDVGDVGRAEIIKILRTFTKMCRLDDEDEPHQQNQKILYNYGEIWCMKDYANTCTRVKLIL